MMTWMMPLMLMFITLSLPSGVGVYWVVSNLFSLFASYYVYGKRILSWRQLLPMPPEAAPETAVRQDKKTRADIEVSGSDYEITDESGDGERAPGEARSHGKRRGKRKKRR
jgi:YidC/Oxa1 family membrane protein insertase